jgi:SAM-dependent methyltransferase
MCNHNFGDAHENQSEHPGRSELGLRARDDDVRSVRGERRVRRRSHDHRSHSRGWVSPLWRTHSVELDEDRVFSYAGDGGVDASEGGRRAAARLKLAEVAQRFGLTVDADALVAKLSVGERQRVEILKALYRGVRILILDEPLEDIDETFDIVVANIIDGVLIQLKPSLLKALKPGGHIFLTGILLEREEIFLEEFIKDSDLQVIRRIENDEWVGYWLKS